MTGLPSLRDIAIRDARTTIKQIYGVKQEYLNTSSTRKSKLDKNELPEKVNTNFTNTLLHEMLILAKQKRTCEIEKPKSKPLYLTLYEEAVKSIEQEKTIDPFLTLSLYSNLCKDHFNIFETNDRRLKFRTPTKKLIHNHICKVYPPVSKDCSTIDDLRKKCLVCGINNSCSSIKCCIKGCNFGAHLLCLNILKKLESFKFECDSFMCNSILQEDKILHLKQHQINSYIKNAASSHSIPAKRRKFCHLPKQIKRKRFLNEDCFCNICNDYYPLDQESHIKSHCTGLSSTPIGKSKSKLSCYKSSAYINRLKEYTKIAAENFKVA